MHTAQRAGQELDRCLRSICTNLQSTAAALQLLSVDADRRLLLLTRLRLLQRRHPVRGRRGAAVSQCGGGRGVHPGAAHCAAAGAGALAACVGAVGFPCRMLQYCPQMMYKPKALPSVASACFCCCNPLTLPGTGQHDSSSRSTKRACLDCSGLAGLRSQCAAVHHGRTYKLALNLNPKSAAGSSPTAKPSTCSSSACCCRPWCCSPLGMPPCCRCCPSVLAAGAALLQAQPRPRQPDWHSRLLP